jgi:hypothetical protein
MRTAPTERDPAHEAHRSRALTEAARSRECQRREIQARPDPAPWVDPQGELWVGVAEQILARRGGTATSALVLPTTRSGPGPPRGPARCRMAHLPATTSASESVLDGGAFSAWAAVQSVTASPGPSPGATPSPPRPPHRVARMWRTQTDGSENPCTSLRSHAHCTRRETCRRAGRSPVLPCAAQQLDPAERVGFEPTRQLPAHTISSRAP